MIGSLSPLALTLVIVFVLGTLGAVMALVYNLRKFSGFQQVGRDAERIASALGAESFRDSGDLVISGNFRGLPTVVRFSNPKKEDVPALNLRIGVPANFSLWIAPRSADPGEGRVILRTGDAALDHRWITRSDDPAQARLFLSLTVVPELLQQFASTSGTFIALSQGLLEISETEISIAFSARHVLDRLQAAARLADALKQMPAADTVKVKPLRKEKHLLARAAIVVGAVAAFALVVAETQRASKKEPPLSLRERTAAAGILPVNLPQIVGLDGWRVATADDFDPDAAAWLRNNGAAVSGRVLGDFSGRGTHQDAAYLLVRSDGMCRVVFLAAGVNRFDVRYPAVAMIARIPKSSLGSSRWLGAVPADIAGDGLLIVRNTPNQQSAVVLFISGNHMISAVPQDYRELNPE